MEEHAIIFVGPSTVVPFTTIGVVRMAYRYTHMASTSAPGFKEVVGTLPPPMKERLQRGLQSTQALGAGVHSQVAGRGPTPGPSAVGGAQPSINLKMNFLPKA